MTQGSDALTCRSFYETCFQVELDRVRPGQELEPVAEEAGWRDKVRSVGAKFGAGVLETAGDIAHMLKGENAVHFRERCKRGADALRGEDVERMEGDCAPADKSTAWAERTDWIRLFERWAVAREIGAKVPESMNPDAWAWILGAPLELAKSNLRDLDALLSGVEGWRRPLVSVAGHLQAYEHALDELSRLPDGDEEQLPRLHKETKTTLEELMKGFMELARGASRMPSGDVR